LALGCPRLLIPRTIAKKLSLAWVCDVALDAIYLLPLIVFLSFPEHLNVTTFFAGSTNGLPVRGFLPFLSFLSRTENFPNPLMRTSFPSPRVPLMISKRQSTSSADCFLVRPTRLWITSEMSAFVRVMQPSFLKSCLLLHLRPCSFSDGDDGRGKMTEPG
jgi:hypothetical protein